ncbi:MAG: G8 domain-containing protein, partial [Planctomycetaceae bacterium]|nr:G8 domain-containing protein [Planctomycetaceae bacterium]
MKNRWLEPLRRQLTAPGSSRKRRKKGNRTSLVAAEVCESRVLLSGSSMMGGGGHGAALALVDTSAATHTVVASGSWTDPAIWQNGTLPTSGARVVIPAGQSVTVDSVMPEEFKTVRVDGTLRFQADVNTELRVDTLVTTMSGRLEMGTAASPIQENVTARIVFADDGAIDTNWDPQQLSRGALLMGQTEIQGAAKTHRSTLAAFPRAGEQTLQLTTAPAGWKMGDSLTITGTQGATSDEVRTISAIDGTTVTLDRALNSDHVPPRSDLNVYVANTTRNVQLESENTQLDRRGHVMFMHTLDASVAHASFLALGRTDKSRPLDDINFDFTEGAVGNETSAGVVFTTTTGARTNVRGRYSVHFHRGGTSPTSTPAVVSGSVVVGSPGYGFVNHTSNVNFIDNVAYNVAGSAYYTEAGDEIGTMTGNIAIRTVSPTFRLGDEGAIDPDLRADVQDFGVDGDGFWLSGHLVSMNGNVSAGATGHGIIIWSDGLVEADRGRATVRVADVANGHLITGRETIPTWWAPMAEMTNNESYGATIGFRSRYVHSAVYLGEQGSAFHTPPDQAYIDTLNPVVDGLTVWGSRDGVLLNYNERLSLKNARIIGTGAPYVQNGGTADTGVGIDMYNEVSRGPGVLENIQVEGFNMGILMPRHDSWSVSNVSLSNTTDMLITEARAAARQLDMNNVTFGSLDGTAVAGNEGQRQNVVMQADLEADAAQPYWFLLENRTTLNGQGLYFNQQAASHVPLETLDNGSLIAPVSSEFVGQTNQQLQDRYGTSFGGAITPADATPVSWVSGGVVGSAAAPPATYPPLYSMIGEAQPAILVDPGTLTNFDGPGGGGGDGDDGTGDDGSDDEGSDDEGSDDEGSDDEGSDDEGSDDEGSDDEGSDDEGSDDEGSDDEGSDD